MKNSRVIVSILALLALAATGYSLAGAKTAKQGQDCCVQSADCCESTVACCGE